MRKVLLALLFTVCAAAQTTIQGTLTFPNGVSSAGCVITITGPNTSGAVTTGGTEVVPGKFTVLIPSNGVYSFQLQPNDAMTPSGTSYAAFYSCVAGSVTHSESWVVPTSSSPLMISQIRVASPPNPSLLINSGQISAIGVPNGYCFVALNGKAVWSPSCGTGSGTSSPGTWSSATNTWSQSSGTWSSQ